jgi:large subunit ribosomal protein L31
MREKIHPDYKECKVTCGCGNTFVTRSTKSEVHVEICSACHPFYTGKQKFVDTAGRVEKFQKRHAWDESSLGKALEKEAPKKNPKKYEKVTVGLPKLKKRKEAEGAEGAEDAEGESKSKGPQGKGKGAKGGAKPPEASQASREGSGTQPAKTEA